MDNFLDIQLNKDNMDIYYIRKSIKSAIDKNLNNFNGIFLDLGCGDMHYRDYILSNSKIEKYISIDIEHPNYHKDKKPDLFWNGVNLPLEDNSIDTIMATEVFEHIPNLQNVITEINRVLKPGGMIFFTIPYLWPLHDAPFDEYRYTPYSLERIFRKANFNMIQLEPTGGWDASLAQMIGLWINRTQKSNEQKKEYKEEYFSLYKDLLETDIIDINFTSGSMITGIIGKAYKKEERIIKENNLLIFTHNLNAATETFIKKHINLICPHNTYILTASESNNTNILQVTSKSNFYRFDKTEETKVINFFEKNCITHILIEFGHIGASIIELNSRLFHLPIFICFHGYDASVMLKQQESINYYMWMQRNITNIIVGSNDMKNRLVFAGFEKEKILINNYGVDIPNEISTEIENDICKFIFIGRFVNKKAPLITIQAFSKALNTVSNITLDIIGNDNGNGYTEKINKYIKQHDLEKVITLHGRQNHSYVKEKLKSSSCYLQHSIIDPENGDMEGMPNIILEASSYGLPVISTFHSGIPECVDNNTTGFLVQENDIDTMSEKMILLAKDKKLRKEMGQKGREKISTYFSTEKSINGLKKLIFKESFPVHNFKYYPLPKGNIENIAYNFLSKKIILLPSETKIILYGFGELGNNLYQNFKLNRNIIGIIDKNKKGHIIDKIKISELSSITNNERYTVFITVLNKSHIPSIIDGIKSVLPSSKIISTLELT